MNYLLASIVLSFVSNLVAGELDVYREDLYENIRQDIKELNISCSAYDSCDEDRDSDSLASYACHCGINCARLGTCCLDSYYIDVPQPKQKPSCRSAYNGKSYFMVDGCPSRDSVYESLCASDWNGEDDILKIVPVTSLFTFITYKNYFCFKCHESGEELMYWTVEMTSEDNISDEDLNQLSGQTKHSSLRYDDSRDTWMVTVKGGVSVPVNLSVTVPHEISSLGRDCEMDVISSCSDAWSDEAVSDKCRAYMAIKHVKRDDAVYKYQNVHCALCNFEKSEDVVCKEPLFSSLSKRPFSFRDLLDINRSNGDVVGQQCDDEYVWDPYAERCRKLSCALPGYTVKEGKCVQG